MGSPLATATGRKASSVETVTHDIESLFAELAAQSRATSEGMTMGEIISHARLSRDIARRSVQMAVASGRCRAVRKSIQDISGVWRKVPAYVFSESAV